MTRELVCPHCYTTLPQGQYDFCPRCRGPVNTYEYVEELELPEESFFPTMMANTPEAKQKKAPPLRPERSWKRTSVPNRPTLDSRPVEFRPEHPVRMPLRVHEMEEEAPETGYIWEDDDPTILGDPLSPYIPSLSVASKVGTELTLLPGTTKAPARLASAFETGQNDESTGKDEFENTEKLPGFSFGDRANEPLGEWSSESSSLQPAGALSPSEADFSSTFLPHGTNGPTPVATYEFQAQSGEYALDSTFLPKQALAPAPENPQLAQAMYGSSQKHEEKRAGEDDVLAEMLGFEDIDLNAPTKLNRVVNRQQTSLVEPNSVGQYSSSQNNIPEHGAASSFLGAFEELDHFEEVEEIDDFIVASEDSERSDGSFLMESNEGSSAHPLQPRLGLRNEAQTPLSMEQDELSPDDFTGRHTGFLEEESVVPDDEISLLSHHDELEPLSQASQEPMTRPSESLFDDFEDEDDPAAVLSLYQIEAPPPRKSKVPMDLGSLGSGGVAPKQSKVIGKAKNKQAKAPKKSKNSGRLLSFFLIFLMFVILGLGALSLFHYFRPNQKGSLSPTPLPSFDTSKDDEL